MIASRLGAASESSVSLTASRYESVAAMMSFDPSNCTSTPVSTGRDSSRDAARDTRPIVSSSAPASTLEVCTVSTSGSRGKSSTL